MQMQSTQTHEKTKSGYSLSNIKIGNEYRPAGSEIELPETEFDRLQSSGAVTDKIDGRVQIMINKIRGEEIYGHRLFEKSESGFVANARGDLLSLIDERTKFLNDSLGHEVLIVSGYVDANRMFQYRYVRA